ncbi:MAG: siphovirus Gp157 family protein, partial [Oscillospiraceae bacterium]|nr:siphovirus Gp157 family protein [Oscillospiraceae bacterium]
YVADDITVLRDGHTIETLVATGTCHVEVTTLVVPGLNDTPAEIEALTDRLRAKQKKLLALDGYIGDTMHACGKERLDTARVSLSFRASESVMETDAQLIPAAYWRETVKREIDKAKIKAAIKAGEVVPGAEIVKKQNLQIK